MICILGVWYWPEGFVVHSMQVEESLWKIYLIRNGVSYWREERDEQFNMWFSYIGLSAKSGKLKHAYSLQLKHLSKSLLFCYFMKENIQGI